MMILVYVFSESPFQAAGLKLSGLSSESDGESVFQITMQVSDLSFGSLYVEAVSLTGHLTVVTGYFTVCLFYDESIGQHGFADAFEQFMHVIVLGIDGLPVTCHVDILFADDKFACIVQLGMRMQAVSSHFLNIHQGFLSASHSPSHEISSGHLQRFP